MADQRHIDETKTAPAQPANEPQTPGQTASEASAEAKPLTPEEQMALYEEKLKEDDWGHQPC